MSRHWTTRVAIVALFIAAPLAAQQTLPDTSAQNATESGIRTAVILPSITNRQALLAPSFRADTSIDMRARQADAAAARAVSSEGGTRTTAMMIVGGAAIIVGAVVGGSGGTAIAVGGGVLGLIGLWNYLK